MLVFVPRGHSNIWITAANNSMSAILLPVILLSSKVASEFSIVSTFLSETVDKLTSELQNFRLHHLYIITALLLILFIRQFLSFSCVFTVFAALLPLLFTTSSFLCLNPLNPFRFFLLIIRFLTLQDFTILSLWLCSYQL